MIKYLIFLHLCYIFYSYLLSYTILFLITLFSYKIIHHLVHLVRWTNHCSIYCKTLFFIHYLVYLVENTVPCSISYKTFLYIIISCTTLFLYIIISYDFFYILLFFLYNVIFYSYFLHFIIIIYDIIFYKSLFV